MFAKGLLAIAGLLALLPSAAPRAADCADPPAPGVVWERCYIDGRDLAGQNLSRARLVDSSFERADLRRADLSGASGYHAKFFSTQMAGAKLDGGSFPEADFTRADLQGASLKNADLRRAKFFRTNLKAADLSGAKLAGADMLNAELSGATWTDGKRVCAEGSVGQCN